MINKVFVIDDSYRETEIIVDAIDANIDYLDPYPKNEVEHGKIELQIKSFIESNHSNKKAEELIEFVQKNLGEQPVLYIIDITFYGNGSDTSGLILGERIKESLPSSNIVYISHYDRSEIIGTRLKEKDFIKKTLLRPGGNVGAFVRKIIEKIPQELIAQNNVTKDDNNSSTKNDIPKIDTTNQNKKLASLTISHQEEKLKELIEIKKGENTILKYQNELVKLENPNTYWLAWSLNFLFRVIIVGSILFLVWFSFGHIIYLAWEQGTKFNISPFHIVEYLFLSPIPLIVCFTFYRYYKNILEPLLFNIERDVYNEQKKSMLDINISKYLFVSILFSTMLVTVIEFFSEASKLQAFGTSSLSKAQADSIKFLSDTTILSSTPLKNITLGNLRNHQSHFFEDKDLALFAFIVGGAILILLVFYLFKLEKHISSKNNNYEV